LIAWEKKKPKEWQAELRMMLEKYGKVGDFVVMAKKAVAVFATATQAAEAVANNQNHPELKFKLKPMLVDEEQAQVPQTTPGPSILSAPAQYDDDYEAQTLQLLLRRQQEKHTS